MLNLDEFYDATGIRLPDGPYETAAGYMLQALGHLPAVGDAVELEGVRLTVRALDGRRIERIRVTPAPANDPNQPGDDDGTGPSPAGDGLGHAPDLAGGESLEGAQLQ